MTFINGGREYKSTADFAGKAGPLVMELKDKDGKTQFVNAMTEEGCRTRARNIYGDYKEIVITEEES